jgi:vacuolar-type H+-ATPase subunit B/Vma2
VNTRLELQPEYTRVTELRGPILVVRDVTGVGWDEFATIRVTAGGGREQVRHGLVLEVDRDLAAVQVFEGTSGLAPASTRVAFSGHPLEIPVTSLVRTNLQWTRRTDRRRTADLFLPHRTGCWLPAQPDMARTPL